MEIRPYLLQALSPLHAGTGQTAGIIDLPIARMRATGIPFVPGSTVKGVMRALTEPADDRDAGQERAAHNAVFGPRRDKPGPQGDTALDHAGALIAADARLLALPVRCFRGTFAQVSSPLLLELARRDMAENPALAAQLPDAIPPVSPHGAAVTSACINVIDQRVILEELDLPVQVHPAVSDWADLLARAVPDHERPLLTDRFVVVDDETMGFLWETATQVDTRIRLDENGVVAGGALWTEESLPPETLLLGLLAARPSMREGCALSAETIVDWALERSGSVIQLGGKATIGRGRCRVLTWPARTPSGEEGRHAHP